MRISILTTITNPIERQDKFLEALTCYCDFADEVVVVNGGNPIVFTNPPANFNKIKIVDYPWDEEWNWIDLPKHLNFGLQACTGDWIIKFDIDQLIHERNFQELRSRIENIPAEYASATMQKATFTHGGKWFQKGEVENIFRNRPDIRIGKNTERYTDLCFPVHQTGVEVVYQEDSIEIYDLPIGTSLKCMKTGVKFWNYDYFFKTQEFSKKEFWRFSRAYKRYFNDWGFGDTEENSFKKFIQAKRDRYNRATSKATLDTHPVYMRQLVMALTPEQYGYNGWGII